MYFDQGIVIFLLKVKLYFLFRACLELIPHKHFTFSKIWLLYAYFEIRQKNLTAARKRLVSK